MTYNTGNPIGSTDARDRLDNSENMDILENSTTLNAHPDRLGTMRKTRKGMELEHDNQISAHEAEHDAQISAHEAEHDNQMQSFENDFDSRLAGMAFTRVGTFTTGATLTDMRQTLLWELSQGGDGREYGWTGSFLPAGKVVTAGSSPTPVSAGNWVDRTEDRLRSDLLSASGAEQIYYKNAALSMTAQALSKRLASEIFLSDYEISADGVTNDAASLLQALNDCKSINNAGNRPVLKFPVCKRILISYNIVSATSEPTISNALNNSWYNFNGWSNTVWGDESWTGEGGVTIDLNGSTLLIDGNDYSLFMASTVHKKIVFKNGTIRNYDKTKANACFILTMLWATWVDVTITGFKKSRALNIYGERNTFFGLNLINNLTHLRLGGPELGTWDYNQANENRFYGLNMMSGGLSLAEPDNITCGFLEIYSSQCPRFFGGSWKSNKNPIQLYGCWSGTFDGVYLESNGFAYGGGVWPGDSHIPPRGRKLHCIFNAINSPINNVVCALHNIVFKNCFIGGYCNFLFSAGYRHFGDGVERQMHIDGVTFEDCTWGDQVYFIHDSDNSVSMTHNVKTKGSKFWRGIGGTPLGVGGIYSSISQDRTLRQYRQTYPVAWDGADFASSAESLMPGVSSSRAAYDSLTDGIRVGGENNALLSTYKESTFTPKLYAEGVDASTSYGVTYSFAQGQYIKIGKLVYGELVLNISSKGSLNGTEQITIGSLPYPPGYIGVYGGNESAISIVDSYYNFTGLTGNINAVVDIGTDRLTLKHNSGNSFVLASNLTATSGVRIGMSYISEV